MFQDKALAITLQSTGNTFPFLPFSKKKYMLNSNWIFSALDQGWVGGGGHCIGFIVPSMGFLWLKCRILMTFCLTLLENELRALNLSDRIDVIILFQVLH